MEREAEEDDKEDKEVEKEGQEETQEDEEEEEEEDEEGCFLLHCLLSLANEAQHITTCHSDTYIINLFNGARIAQLVVLGLAVHSVTGSILLWGHFR